MIEVTENELTIYTPGEHLELNYFELSKCDDGDLYLQVETAHTLAYTHLSPEMQAAIRDFITQHLKEHEQKGKAES